MIRSRGPLWMLGVVLSALLLIPMTVAAQATSEEDSFSLQVNSPTTIAADQVMGSVISISADAVVDGQVKDTLWVVDGTATVNGQVGGDVMVINGTLNLASGSTVKNVTLIRSTMNRADGASITGDLHERSEFVSFGWGASIFSFVFWIGTTIVILLIGLLFIALFGGYLREAGQILVAQPLASFVTGLVTWVVLPIVAVLALITIIGIPLGLVILLVAMPLLGLLGYIVAGDRLGMVLMGRTGGATSRFLPVIVGLLIFQVIGLIPVLGGLVVALAGFFGTGAFIYHLYRDRRTPRQGAATIGDTARA